ncbi:hypothetical protein [Agathobacter sp.]
MQCTNPSHHIFEPIEALAESLKVIAVSLPYRPLEDSERRFVTPKFYAKPDGSPFGAIALTEGTETILPKMPQNEYAVDGKRVPDWKMVLVSTTKDSIIGDCDYQKALKKLEKHTLDSNENTILIKGLSLDELEAIVE